MRYAAYNEALAMLLQKGRGHSDSERHTWGLDRAFNQGHLPWFEGGDLPGLGIW